MCTDKGQQILDAALRMQTAWVDALAQGLSTKDIETAHRVMLALRQRLDGKDVGRLSAMHH
jgi:hypothetical protein